jgi:hypothetical protein
MLSKSILFSWPYTSVISRCFYSLVWTICIVVPIASIVLSSVYPNLPLERYKNGSI